MPVTTVALKKVLLPEFGEPTIMPTIQRATLEARVDAALARAKAAGLDALVVYGDREHSANIAFLSGYDPRFEEALLVLVPGKTPALLVGNEGWGYAELCDGPYERVLCQTFSLPAQPRDRSEPLPDILASAGLQPGQRIGAIGWKPFTRLDHGFGETSLDGSDPMKFALGIEDERQEDQQQEGSTEGRDRGIRVAELARILAGIVDGHV